MRNISEKDLYNFVFYPDDLSEDKRLYILDNIQIYQADIDLLIELKLHSEDTVPEEVLNKIYSKIKKVSTPIEIILNKIKPLENNEYLILAADSPKQQEKKLYETFISDDGSYLIKINTTEKESKIFVINTDQEIKKNYILTLKPSNTMYEFHFL